LTDKGASGYCSYYAINRYYSEGNYVNDFLTGTNCLSINMKKMSVYYGNVVNGEFTGKQRLQIAITKYLWVIILKETFMGKVTKYIAVAIQSKAVGRIVVCSDATQITNDKGVAISKSPKTIADAVTILVNAGFDNYEIFGGEDEENNYGFADVSYKSLLNLPGSLKKDLVIYDYDDNPIYFSPYVERLSFEKATTKYNDLCKQIKAVKIVLKAGAKPEMLTGEINKPEEGEKNSNQF
jgi:hypothetical protein